MITKEKILSSTSEEKIIEHYVPDFKPSSKQNYHSIFSETDKKPSLHFYQTNGSWKFKSHNTGNQGDIFQFVADIYNINVKQNFPDVLNKINEDLKLNIEDKEAFKIQNKPYSKDFLAYWQQFGVIDLDLERFNITQVSSLSFKSVSGKYYYFNYDQLQQLAVCYNVNERIKIYIPEYKKQAKSFGYKNQIGSDIFGLKQLAGDYIKYIILCAGEKDCLIAAANGFNAVSMQSETQMPTDQLMKELKLKSPLILCCYDNDETGKRASEKLKNLFGIDQINLPDEFKDLADYFKVNKSEDFKILVENTLNKAQNTTEEAKEKTVGKTVFHMTEEYLLTRFKFRFNKIKHVFESCKINDFQYSEINENSLFIELNKAGIKISLNNLKALLKSEFCNQYNPIGFYFESLKEWKNNDPDYINMLGNYVSAVDQKAFNNHLKMWMVRTVKCALVDGYYNKHALILVNEAQNSGKTSFLRFLCPPALKDYIVENINPEQKDSLIALATNFIINLDELASLSKSDVNALKSWISQDKVNVRLPYESRASVVQRICSFVGSTNMGEFLTDSTGSVRWLCFKVNEINHEYSNYITGKSEIDINDVWAQAYSLYKSGFKCELNQTDIMENEERNAMFRQLSAECELLPGMITPCTEGEIDCDFMSATDIQSYMQSYTNVKLNAVMIGRALSFHKFNKVKHKKLQRYGYWCHKLK